MNVTPCRLLFALIVLPVALAADGYRNPPEGARAIGAFGGHRAFADDASAVIHNPANLPELERSMIQLNATFGYGRNTFERTGVSDQTENPVFALPGFAVAVPMHDGRWALGLAAYVPYGRSVDWGQDSFFARNNISYSGSMTVADLTPNVAVQINEALSLALGADFYYGTVEQKTRLTGLPAMMLGLPSGTESRLDADGDGLGWNAALTWKVTDRQRLAATYRAPFTITYEGDNELSTGSKSTIRADIEYPAIAALAYGVEFTDTLRAELNGEWLEFSQYERLTLDDSDPRFATTVQQKLKDTWTAGLGLAWDFIPQWTLRSGCMYIKNPTPDETYSPLGPDENQAVLSLGLGYETETHAIDIGYAYGLFDGRTVQDSVNSPDGHYDYDVHLLALSYGFSF